MSWSRALRLLAAAGAICPVPAAATCPDPSKCGCVVTTTMVAFGVYDPQSAAAADSAGTIAMSCSSAEPGQATFAVGLSAGGSGDIDRRLLRNGAMTIAYNLYSDPGRTIIWGDSASDMVAAAFPPAGGPPQLITIYGRVPARQNAVPGDYRDVITVTVSY